MIARSNPLYVKADFLAKLAYQETNSFPRAEQYGITS